jgi:hypothetical protein
MSGVPSSRAFRVSLREFLLLFAAIAVGFTALKHANSWWLGAIAAIAMLFFMASAVVALVDRGARQAFALGFIACMASYLSIFFVETELHPYQGRFPTTRLLRRFFESVREQLYVDEASGDQVLRRDLPPNAQIIEDYSWTIATPPNQGGAIISRVRAAPSRSGAPGQVFRRIGDVPPRQMLVPVGHFLWGIALGYVGGHFGRYVYARRLREQRHDGAG